MTRRHYVNAKGERPACPECGAFSAETTDSSLLKNGVRYRRHLCESGHRFTTHDGFPPSLAEPPVPPPPRPGPVILTEWRPRPNWAAA